MSHYLGLLAGVMGRRLDAIKHLECAVENNEAMGLRPFAVYSRVALAKQLGRHGKDELAAEQRSAALEVARELGMKAVVAALAG